MKPLFRTSALLLSLLGPVAGRSAALAQAPVSAEAIFDRGVEQMNAGNYASGCKDIAESQRLEPMPGTLFSLATCMDRWGHVATAVRLYGEYLDVYEQLPDVRKPKQGDRPSVATAQREKLRPEVPELTLALPPNPPAGTLVKRDGQEVAATALGVALPVDPGEYVVTTQAPGGPVWEQRITIGKGERKKVTLEVKAARVIFAPPRKVEPLRSPLAPPAPERLSGQRKAAYATFGVGAAGLALGGVMGGLALRGKGTIDQHCGAAIMAPKARCDPMGLDAARSAQTFGLVSTLGVAVAIAGVGTGVVLLATDRAPASSKAGVRGQGITGEVLSIGPAPAGAMIRARGAF